MSRVLRDARQREEEIKRHYISADHDITDQDYYQRYLRDSAPTMKYTKPKLKRNNILQPTTPSVFQVLEYNYLKASSSAPSAFMISTNTTWEGKNEVFHDGTTTVTIEILSNLRNFGIIEQSGDLWISITACCDGHSCSAR